MDAFDPANCPGACVPCLVDTGRIVQMSTSIDGVEVCASCAAAHAEAASQATEGVDASFGVCGLLAITWVASKLWRLVGS